MLISACSAEIDSSAWGDAAPQPVAKPTSSQRILVFGGTSGVGLETVKYALDRGHQVVAGARRPQRMALAHNHLQTIKADITDAESVTLALAEIDTVVIAIGIPPTREPVSVFSEGTANVLEAMTRHGVNRIIVVTGIGAGQSRGHGGFFYDNILQPLALKTIYEDKDRSEELLMNSNTQWTIVRPGFLNDKPASNRYRVVMNMSGVTAADIPRADVAHFIVSVLESNSYSQETVLLTN